MTSPNIMPTIFISDFARWIMDAVEDGDNLYAHGPTGIGKTQIIEQVHRTIAAAKGWDFNLVGEPFEMSDPENTYGFVDLRTANLDSLDTKGGPLLDREAELLRFLPPSLLPDAKRHGNQGVFVLDEYAQGYDMVINSLNSIVQEGRCGDAYIFPKNWTIIAMSNRKSDNCGVKPLQAHTYNRFEHVEVLPDVPSFAAWSDAQGFDGALKSFLRIFPEFIHNYNKGDIAFPTPRSLVKANARYVKYADDPDYRDARIAACCGMNFAVKFSAHLAMRHQLVPFGAIVKDPENAHVPEVHSDQGSSALYALIGILFKRVEHATIDAAMTYVSRMPVGFQMTFVTDLKNHPEKKALIDTRAVSAWRAANPDFAV